MHSFLMFCGTDGFLLPPWSCRVHAISRMSHAWAEAGRPNPQLDVSTGRGDRGAAIITFNGLRLEPVLAEEKILAGFQREGAHVTPLACPTVCVPGQDLFRI